MAHEAGPAPRAGPAAPIRILIAEDDPLLCELLEAFISEEPDMQVVGWVCDGDTAIRWTRELAPDILLLDIHMPGTSGLEVLQSLNALADPTLVLALTGDVSGETAARVLELGARGYLIKPDGGERLSTAVRAVVAGERWISPRMNERLQLESDGRDGP